MNGLHLCWHAIKRAGAETVYAKFLSDQTGIPLDKIIVVQGDRIDQRVGAPADRVRSPCKQRHLATVDKMVESFTLSCKCRSRGYFI